MLGVNYNDLDINDKVNALGTSGDDPSSYAFGFNNPEAIGDTAANIINKSKLMNDAMSNYAPPGSDSSELFDAIMDASDMNFIHDPDTKAVTNNAIPRMMKAPKQALKDMFAQYSQAAADPGKYLS